MAENKCAARLEPSSRDMSELKTASSRDMTGKLYALQCSNILCAELLYMSFAQTE